MSYTHIINESRHDVALMDNGELEVGIFVSHHEGWTWCTLSLEETEKIRKALNKEHKQRKEK